MFGNTDYFSQMFCLITWRGMRWVKNARRCVLCPQCKQRFSCGRYGRCKWQY